MPARLCLVLVPLKPAEASNGAPRSQNPTQVSSQFRAHSRNPSAGKPPFTTQLSKWQPHLPASPLSLPASRPSARARYFLKHRIASIALSSGLIMVSLIHLTSHTRQPCPAGRCSPYCGQGLPAGGRLSQAEQLLWQWCLYCCCQAAEHPRCALCHAQGGCADQGQGETIATAAHVRSRGACTLAAC